MKKNIYAGLGMVSLATLMLEILLTRIFSVTMWYHFAFVAISVSLFGMTVGAILVYLFPGYFTEARATKHLAAGSFLFSLTIVAGFLIQLRIPFIPERSVIGLSSIALTYIVISVPFVFSGICVCLALTKFPKQVSALYAVDLAGAALGCILLIWTLKITDGPTAVIIVASLAGLGSVFFAADGNSKKAFWGALVTCLLLVSFSIVNTLLAYRQSSLLRVIWVKGKIEDKPIYEKWNPFSRVAVFNHPTLPQAPRFWGMSQKYKLYKKGDMLSLNIDAFSATALKKFNGDLNDLEYLKYDVTNLAHYLRPDSKVLIIGTGGGRDILAALAFHQKPIIGVEINEDIIKIVNGKFGDFTGHLDKNPDVFFINDEARAFIVRTPETFDIIQASFIDTWAATAAGAFVLSENSLYTVEAWKIFLDHLTPSGVLTFSRWYYNDNPGEIYRLTSLAAASLMKAGVKNPRDHILIVQCMGGVTDTGPQGIGIGTILVSKKPFSGRDIEIFEKVAHDMQFDIVLTPRFSIDTAFAAIASGKDLTAFTLRFPINIAAPTDDSPFFFNMLRFKNMFDRKLWNQGFITFNMNAMYVLGILLITVVGLTFVCIILPLMFVTKTTMLKGSLPFFIFFMAIGCGFMLVEISQMQRMIIFLGHPVYGLSVVLFALLLSSGLGSYSTQKTGQSIMGKLPVVCLVFLLCTLTIFGLFTTHILNAFQGSPTTVRIFLAVVILFSLGFFMGMPFPFGLKLASIRFNATTPWFWGLNGATSVCSSVVAVVISLCAGISVTFWAGFLCYIVACIMFVWARKRAGDVPRGDILFHCN